MDYNARKINAQIASVRNNPAAAGSEDCFEMGWDYGMRGKPLHGAKVGSWADPRWRNNREYRAAFRSGAREGHRFGRKTLAETTDRWEG